MKNIYVLSLLPFFLLTPAIAWACDACGCGASGGYHIGILPQWNKHFIGLRYRYSSYDSYPRKDGLLSSSETFRSVELWGRFYPLKRVQVLAFVPYHFNHRTGEQIVVSDLRGLGDISVMASYNVINTYDSLYSPVKHNLLLGGGVKLPTGQFQALQNGLTVNQNFQLGTGSLDYLLSAIYTVRYGNVGINGNLTYKYNTQNSDGYRFGNQTSASASLFYQYKQKFFTLMPNAGVVYESARKNRSFDQYFEETGGQVTMLGGGLESYWKNLSMGISYQHPIRQNLFQNQVVVHDRMVVHLTCMF